MIHWPTIRKIVYGSGLAVSTLLAWIPAVTADSCTAAATTISSVITDQCHLTGSETVTVTSNGDLSYSDGTFAFAIRTDGVDHTIDNAGLVTGNGGTFGYGVANYGNTSTLSNSGTITGNGADFGFGLTNYGTLTTLTNTGTITGNAAVFGFGLANYGTLTTLTNTGTISGGTSGAGDEHSVGVFNNDTILETLNNSGTIDGLDLGIYNNGSATLTTLTNDGMISGAVAGIRNDNSSTITTLTNNSTISSILNQGTIATLVNSGDINGYDGSGTAGTINNTGTISNSSNGTIATSGGFTNSGVLALAAGTVTNVTGDYTQTSSGIFRTGISDDTTYGQLLVSGTATLPSNAQIDVNVSDASFSFNASSIEDVISANMLASDGTFAVTDNSLLFDFDALMDGNTVDLSLIAATTNNTVLSVAAGSTHTITGNYSQSTDGIFRTHISDDNTYGKLVVSGNATLPSNARIDVNVTDPNFNFSVTSFADIISAATLAADGTFSVTDNSLLFNFDALKDGNTIDLTLAVASMTPDPDSTPDLDPVPEKSIGVRQAVIATGNVSALGAASVMDDLLTTFVDNGSSGNVDMDTVITALGRFSTEQQVSNAMSQTLPVLNGDARRSVFSSLQNVRRRAIDVRIGTETGGAAGAYKSSGRVWVRPFNGQLDQDDDQGLAGFDADVKGLAMGIDREIGNASTVGLAFTYADIDVDSNSNVAPQNLEIASYQLTAYGSYALNSRTNVIAELGIGRNKTDAERSIGFMGLTAESDYDSDTVHTGVSLEHFYIVSGGLSITPSLRLDYHQIDDNSYTENGAGALNLVVESNRGEQLLVTPGSDFAYQLSANFTLLAELSVSYDLADDQSSVTSAFAGSRGSRFVVEGLDPEPWHYNAGIGLRFHAVNGMDVAVRVDGKNQDQATNYTASANVSWLF